MVGDRSSSGILNHQNTMHIWCYMLLFYPDPNQMVMNGCAHNAHLFLPKNANISFDNHIIPHYRTFFNHNLPSNTYLADFDRFQFSCYMYTIFQRHINHYCLCNHRFGQSKSFLLRKIRHIFSREFYFNYWKFEQNIIEDKNSLTNFKFVDFFFFHSSIINIFDRH